MAHRLDEGLKSSIINEYKQGENGYKKLARKYNLTRDSVRSIVKAAIKKNLIPSADSSQ